jgi:phosphatidate phosphatase APP1
VISDIDDTIKISNVTNKLKSLRRLLFTNGYTVEPVPGTAVLYQRLEMRGDGRADGDVQYVSGSPINLSESIYRFMDHRGFPQGAIDLKKWGLGANDDSPFAQQSYKITRLRQIFTTYPNRSFLLFGDSGEKDPEIYRQIASEFPGRVKDIFINNVTGGKPTDARFQGQHLTSGALEQARMLQAAGQLTAEDVDAVGKAAAISAAFVPQP